MVQGIVRGLAEYVKIVEEIHFTHIKRRMIRIKPSIGNALSFQILIKILNI